MSKYVEDAMLDVRKIVAKHGFTTRTDGVGIIVGDVVNGSMFFIWPAADGAWQGEMAVQDAIRWLYRSHIEAATILVEEARVERISRVERAHRERLVKEAAKVAERARVKKITAGKAASGNPMPTPRRQGEAPNEPPPPDFTQAEAKWAELLGKQKFESVRTRSSHRYVEQLQGGREL